ncbi:MAG: hypothetical protein JWP01_3428 [Myxococcales bacterium]|nr:hypothetical protein [Myxococcales bacterium]
MSKLSAWWFAPAPAERLAAVRILIGAFGLAWVLIRIRESDAVARLPAQHFKPCGVVQILDTPLPPGVALAITIATCVLMAAFIVGFRFRLLAPFAALALLWTLTYRNSWGMIFHTENLLVMHVLALSVSPAADAWALDRRPAQASPIGYGWALKLLAAITAVTYVLAAIAKLRIAGMAWLDGEQLRNQIAVDNLRKALFGDLIAPLATQFLDHPSGFTVFSVMTIVLELSAPIVLVGPRPARLWCLAAWGFHVGVVLLMNIWFLYPLLGVAFVASLPAERPFDGLIRRWHRHRGT